MQSVLGALKQQGLKRLLDEVNRAGATVLVACHNAAKGVLPPFKLVERVHLLPPFIDGNA